MSEERNDICDPLGGVVLTSCESQAANTRTAEILQVSYFYDSVARTRLYEVSISRSAAPRGTSCRKGVFQGNWKFLFVRVTRRMCTTVFSMEFDIFAGCGNKNFEPDEHCPLRGWRSYSVCFVEDVAFSGSEMEEGNLRGAGKCMFE